MKSEAERDETLRSAQFRDDVFLHSIAGHIPGLYNELFGEDKEDIQPDEWEVPESLDDLRRMQAELAEVGIPLDFSGLLGNPEG